MIKAPVEWQLLKLGDIAEFKYGKALPAANRDSGEFPVFGSNGIVGSHSKWLSQAPTIVIGRKGSVGEICFSNKNCSPIDTTYYIDNFEALNPKFCFYLLKNLRLGELNKSTAIPGLNRQDAYDLEVAIPPLAEQTRIAQKLDELLAQVDTLKARIDGIPALLKRFRQSVLAAAVSGRLTNDFRENQIISFDDPKPFLYELLKDQWNWTNVPAGWQIKYYSSLFESRLGKMLDKTKNKGEPTAYLGNINVRWFKFEIESLQEILVSEKEREELILQQGDVLICEGGEPGRCAVWRLDNIKVIYQKALHRARSLGEVLPEWLAFNLKNDADRNLLSQLFTGSTIKHLTGRSLEKYPLRLPPLNEQTEIVRRVEQLFALADQLEAKVKTAQTRVDQLTQSILAKAFRGELVPQDPNDEPASVLLERIKAQRAAEPKAKRGRKKVLEA